jgi:NAD(P)-dependent dehydrogenase (short-subunit alcohol dehydrogenase family)
MGQLRFDGLTAVVLGGGNGLGREHALLLASRGARVLVNDIGCSVEGEGCSPDAANGTVEEIRNKGGEAEASTTSGTTQDGARAIIGEARQAFGPVDIIVNSAGIAAELPIVDMTTELVEAHLDVSVKLPMFMAQAAWPSMRERRMGRILNTTSGAGLYGRKGNSAYAAAKMGLVGVTRALALEGADLNIHVNALAPAAATRNSYYLPEPMKTWFETECPAERVAPVAAWLVHPDCEVNGAIVCTAGGRVARAMMCESAVSEPLFTIGEVREQLDKDFDPAGLRIPESAHLAMRAYGAPV